MGCATSDISNSDIAFDAYAANVQRPTRLAKKLATKRQTATSRTGWKDPASLESYTSYVSTPMNAPAGMFTLPDREMHEAHLFALEDLRVLIEKHPIRFANDIERARRRRFPTHASEELARKVSELRVDPAPSLRSVIDSRYASERSQERCSAVESRPNICSTRSDSKARFGQTISLDVSPEPSLRSVIDSRYSSERSQERCHSIKSRANACNTQSDSKARYGKSTSPDVSIASTITPASSGVFDSASADESFSETD